MEQLWYSLKLVDNGVGECYAVRGGWLLLDVELQSVHKMAVLHSFLADLEWDLTVECKLI